MFKKFTAIVIAAAMIGALAITGCGGSSSSSSSSAAASSSASSAAASSASSEESTAAESTAAESTATSDVDFSQYKIGMTLLMEDGVFKTFEKYVQSLADAVGVELVFDVGAFSPDDQIASVENLIAAGCDGIIFCNFGETVLPKVAQLCDEAEVYWVQYCRPIADADVLDTLNNSQYYVGRTIEDNKTPGANIAQKFADEGVTKAAVVGPTPGDSTTDQVSEGFEEKCAELGIEVVTIVRNCDDATAYTEAAQTIMSSFPETEGICILTGTTGYMDGLFKGLENMGKLGEVKVGSLDGTDNYADDLANGYCSIIHSGQYVDPGFSFALLLNAVAGTPLSEDKIEIVLQYIAIESPEDAEAFQTVVLDEDNGVFAYNGEEFKQWLKAYNPDASVESIQAAASAYSVDDVVSRHS